MLPSKTGPVAKNPPAIAATRRGRKDAVDGGHLGREVSCTVDATLPVILTSGYDQTATADRLNADPAVGFLQKPYRVQTLAERISELIGPKPS